jgi:hypothetical protein
MFFIEHRISRDKCVTYEMKCHSSKSLTWKEPREEKPLSSAEPSCFLVGDVDADELSDEEAMDKVGVRYTASSSGDLLDVVVSS